MSHKGWVGVDLDGTLAHYDTWRGPEHIGEPVLAMLNRVKGWISNGYDVRIFTARVSGNDRETVMAENAIKEWCMEHIGQQLPITCTKDFACIEIWDDRAVQVIANTGQPVGESTRGLS